MPNASYRCTVDGCRRRLTLKRPIEAFQIRSPKYSLKQWKAMRTGKCPHCLKGNLSFVGHLTKRWNKKVLCRCEGTVGYPHSRGTDGCIHGDPEAMWK